MQRKEFTRCLKALANERRVRIIQELLVSPPLDIDALARRIKLSYKSTAKHVTQLERCDYLERARMGMQALYRVNRSHAFLRTILAHLTSSGRS